MDQLSLPLTDPSRVVADYLTIVEAARRVRCCERTIRRAIDSGDLRAGRVRGRGGSRGGFRIRAVDLDEWLFRDAP
jgi:excisionase family DNA binding protein